MKDRKQAKVSLNKGAMYEPQQAAELGTIIHVVLELRKEKKWLWHLPWRLRKAAKARHITGVSLNGDLERPFYKTVKLKPGSPW